MLFVDSLIPCKPAKALMEIYPYATLKYLYWETIGKEPLTLEEYKTEFNKIRVPQYKGKRAKRVRLNGLEHNIKLMIRFVKLNNYIDFNPTITAKNFNVLYPTLTTKMSVKELEQVADYLDSVIAAYTVWRYWSYGNTRSVVVGNRNDGYILIPADEYIKERLNNILKC